VAEAKAASAKALVEMDDADLAKETSAGKADPARMAALWGEMQRRAKEVTKAAAKVEREAKSKARKAVVEVIDSLTVAEMQKVQTFASALVAKRK
jgi:formate dehydrogenase maturation protein FdhE